jgi:hypothetical protein
MFASSIATRLATTAFSEQVLTKSRYFWRLSKKRKLRSCAAADAGAACRTGAGAATGAVDADAPPAM